MMETTGEGARRLAPVRFRRPVRLPLGPVPCRTGELTMTLRISDVRLGVDEPEAHLPERLAAVLGVSPADLLRLAHPAQEPRRPRQGRPAIRLHRRGGRPRRGTAPRRPRRSHHAPHRPRRPLPRRAVRRAAVRDAAAAAPAGRRSAPAPAAWRRRTSWPSRAIGRWSWSAAGPCATASATCAPSTPAARSIRRATTCSARAAPARSATAS